MEWKLFEDVKIITNGEQSDRLSPTEFEIVKYLFEHKGKIVSRQELISNIGVEIDSEGALDSHIWNLKNKKYCKLPIKIIPKEGIIWLEGN